VSVISDMAEFARLHVSSGDIDPAYPVLRHMISGLPTEEALSKVLSYVAFYDLSSALRFWSTDEDPGDLPCATERRGLRGGVVERHLSSLEEQRDTRGSWERWLRLGWSAGDNREQRWALTFNNVQQAWGNGRWAAYKTCEILSTVLDWPMAAPDAGHAWSSGPRKGLALVFGPETGNGPGVIRKLDQQTEALRLELAMEGAQLLPVEQLETVLCDFYSMSQGHYYVGHDIDQQLEQLMRPSTPGWAKSAILQARQASFRPAWLGELNGWAGVDKSLSVLYRNTGAIAFREQL
jgi:hypothetical protein